MHGNTKLTRVQVLEIEDLLRRGAMQGQVAALYSVTQSLISNIKQGRHPLSTPYLASLTVLQAATLRGRTMRHCDTCTCEGDPQV